MEFTPVCPLILKLIDLFDKMNYLRCLIIFCFSLLLFSCNSDLNQDNLISAEVKRAISGQTVEVTLPEESSTTKVRIIGIDAPDLRQSPWGKTAQTILSELVVGKVVALEIENNDPNNPYNRIYAHIWQDNSLISEKLIKQGCVLANTKYPHSYSKLLINAQEYARLMGYGIWNPQQPLRETPNQFRSKK